MNPGEQPILSLGDLPLPAWICDAETGSILSANETAARFYGYSESEFSKLKLSDLEAGACASDSQTSPRMGSGGSCDCASVTHRTQAGVRFSVALRVSDVQHRGRRAKLMLSQSSDFEGVACPLEVAPATDLSLPGPQSSVIQRITSRVTRLGTYVIAADEDCVYWSAECAEVHGLEPRETTLTKAEALAYGLVNEQVKAFAAAVARCMRDGEPFDQFLTLQTADDKIRSVRALGEARLGADGRVVAVIGAIADVTEVVELEHHASKVARRLELTLDRMNQAFFMLDADCRIMHANREFARMVKIPQHRLAGKSLWDLLPSARGTELERGLERVMKTGKPLSYSGFAGSAEVWIKARAFAAEGGAAVFFHDASEERSVARQLQLLESAAANTNDMIIVTEGLSDQQQDGPRTLYVNDAFERITGFSKDEAIGSPIRKLHSHQTSQSDIQRVRESLLSGNPIRVELLLQKKSGESFWVEADIVPMHNAEGKCTHVVSTQRDISERKRAEEKLRVSEERFELLSRATLDLVRDWNIAEDAVWWNDAASSQLALDPDAVHRPNSWAAQIHEEDRDRVLSELEQFLAGSETLWEEEYRLLAADGQQHEFMDRGILVRDEHGKPLRMLNSMVDVTERNTINAQLRQSQKLQAVGELTGGLAHDLNNTLTIVIGNAELLASRLDAGNLQAEKALAEMIVSASERSAEMMSRLLKVARKHPLEPSPVNLAAELKTMELLLRQTLSEAYDFTLKPSEALWLADVDLSQFQSALINLVVNARDAMPGGGAMVIETANVTLDEHYTRGVPELEPGEYVKVSVSDTGQGMSAEVRDRAFEPFFTTKAPGAGTGLGLSMIYGFMKQSGGHASIYSEENNGTSVNLYFPRSGHGAAEAEEPVQDPEFDEYSQAHVLIVEDHDLVREHVVEMVQNLGFTVSMAASGSEALETLAANEDIALLFTDVVMPGGMNGPQLAEAARQRYPNLKVLYTSGYTADSLAADGRMPDNTELITKPYRREELARMFYKVLQGGEQG